MKEDERSHPGEGTQTGEMQILMCRKCYKVWHHYEYCFSYLQKSMDSGQGSSEIEPETLFAPSNFPVTSQEQYIFYDFEIPQVSLSCSVVSLALFCSLCVLSLTFFFSIFLLLFLIILSNLSINLIPPYQPYTYTFKDKVLSLLPLFWRWIALCYSLF